MCGDAEDTIGLLDTILPLSILAITDSIFHITITITMDFFFSITIILLLHQYFVIITITITITYYPMSVQYTYNIT